jgi:phosphoribosylformylglycinamidine synthase subunit PurL
VVTLPAGAEEQDPVAALFSESSARVIAVLRRGAEADFAELCAAGEMPATRIGRTGGQNLEVTGLFNVPVAELSAVSARTLPALFGQR